MREDAREFAVAIEAKADSEAPLCEVDLLKAIEDELHELWNACDNDDYGEARLVAIRLAAYCLAHWRLFKGYTDDPDAADKKRGVEDLTPSS